MTSKQENIGALTFGLDIGIASVGWAVLGENRIIDLGVRCFDKAETAKEGESLNLARRTARLLRRRLRRRAWRLTKLARLLKREGLIEDANLFKNKIEKNTTAPKSAWQLRVDGLDRHLNAEEWARVIYHLCKHRGFHWISRAEEKAAEGDSKSEGGKVKQGLAGTKRLMHEKNYRSAAEMVLAEFPEAQRNKQGDYSKALSRLLLNDEFVLLFQRQRELGNSHTSAEFQEKILGTGDKKSGLFWAQNPALAGNDLLKMLGHCTFEKSEYRAPKASFTAERHVWLTRLNNLRIVVDGTTRPLNEAERRIVLLMPYQQAGDFSYKQLRAALTKAGYLPESFRYTGLAYASGQKADEKTKDPESTALVKFPAWHELRKTLEKKELTSEWQKISTDALEGRPQQLDDIAWVLSVYKDDTEVEAELRKLPLPNADKMVDALLDIRFDKFSNLSIKALRQIVPFMEQGQRYDEAVANIPEYGHHSQLNTVGAGVHKYLPPFYKERDKTGRMVFNDDMDIPRNPVVLRALNQARKVMNALIKEYGSPHEVHIEMARDLSRPLDERREIEKLQKEFQVEKEKGLEHFISVVKREPKRDELLKMRLFRQQLDQCPYCQKELDIHRMFVNSDDMYAQVDHVLPYSRSFDDSMNNKVLVHTKCNQDKGNHTPFEYLDGKGDSARWRQFVAFVEGNKSYRLAKRSRLLRKDFGDKEAKEFRERNLNDTRYICKFFKNYVEQYLQLHECSEAKRCVVLSGQMTSFLRARWGLVKVRSDSDRHHALDAAVVAACSHSMVKRLSDYSRRKELEHVRAGFVDMDTGEIINPEMFDQIEKHFPNPWQHFRNELEARLKLDDPVLLREEMQRFGTYSEEILQTLRPLFVSRSVSRRGGGEVHKAKIFGLKEDSTNKAFEKVQLANLTLSKLEKMVGKNDPRNQAIYELLRDRLTSFGDDPKKAFGPQQPKLLKPSKEGKNAPEIRAIRVEETQNSGLLIRGGIADLGEMIAVDVFQQKIGSFAVVPRYQAFPEKMRSTVAAPAESKFCFSLTKNDYVEIEIGTEFVRGYFVMYESDGRMTLRAHDQPQPDKKYFRKSVAGAKNIKKYNIDILGNRYPAPPEKRRDLA